ncbi:MAG: O-antigen ligase family protein [Kiritimatiellales bacterium]|nr:O-antigen ligase family protein [Kiritimatiellales bacterium]
MKKKRHEATGANGSSGGWIILLLFIVPLSSILFYGLAGADKTWLIAPALMLNYTLVTVWFFTNRQNRSAMRSAPLSGGLLLLFLAFGMVLAPFADIPYEAKIEMLALGGIVGAYWTWAGAFSTFRRIRGFLGAFMFVVMLIALYGVVNHFKSPDHVLWTERYFTYEGRLSATYICPNHFAHLLQMLLPFCLVLPFIPQAGIWLRILAGYSLVLFLPPIYLSESRAGWLGSIAALGVTVCLLALRNSRKLFLTLLVVVPLLSAVLLTGAWKYSEVFRRRMKPVVEFVQGQQQEGIGSESKDFRPQTWMDTIDMIKKKPLIGFGPGNYELVFPQYRYRCKAVRLLTGHPHNEYLEMMADYGLIGFGIFAAAWLYGIVRLFVFFMKTPNMHHAYLAVAFLGTMAGTMVHSFFDFQMHVFANAQVFVFLAAVAVGPMVHAAQGRKVAKMKPESENPPAGVFGHWPNILCTILGITFLAATVLCGQTMGSAYLRLLGDRASTGKKAELAERYYNISAKVDRQNWRAYAGLGEIYFKKRYYTLDRDEKHSFAVKEKNIYEKAYNLNQLEPTVVFGLGRVLIYLGEQERGLELLRRVAEYKRFNDYYQWNLGVELRKAGHYEEALHVFDRAMKIKNSPSTKRNIQWLKVKLGYMQPPKKMPAPITEPTVGNQGDVTDKQQGEGMPDEDDPEILLLQTLLDLMMQE